MTAGDILEEMHTALPFIQGITVSGGECTIWEPLVTELFGRVKQLGKTTFADTNGQRAFREMKELTRVMDKAMLDVKAWDALNLRTRYYTPRLHVGAFALPAFLEEMLKEVETDAAVS